LNWVKRLAIFFAPVAESRTKALGIALSRAKALETLLKDQFFEVADFIVENDPAVNSYLRGKPTNISGRICKHDAVIQ
jgi:hypothetical protein